MTAAPGTGPVRRLLDSATDIQWSQQEVEQYGPTGPAHAGRVGGGGTAHERAAVNRVIAIADAIPWLDENSLGALHAAQGCFNKGQLSGEDFHCVFLCCVWKSACNTAWS